LQSESGDFLNRLEADEIVEEEDGTSVATLAYRDMTIKVVVSSDEKTARYRATVSLLSAGRAPTKLNWPDELFDTRDEALQHGLTVGVDTLNTISDFGASSEFE